MMSHRKIKNMEQNELEKVSNFRPEILSDVFLNFNEKADYDVDINEFPLSYLHGEIELVNISMNSHFGDEHSFRLNQTENGYKLIVCSEDSRNYFNYCKFYNEIPTQKEILEIFVNMDLVTGSNFLDSIIEQNEFSNVNEVLEFFIFYSNYYPELHILFKEYLLNKFI